MHQLLAALLTMSLPAQVPAEFVDLFTPLEYRYTGGGYEERVFEYRLYVPEVTAGPMPLVVWLHGVGEAGQDNVNHLRWLERLVFRRSWKVRDYPFFFLAVQCPRDNNSWTRASANEAADDMLEVARAIVEETLRTYPIDRDRVVLAGISSGGSGCWEFAARYPQMFAAVAPMASGGAESAELAKLVDLPVWAFHSRDDRGTPIDGVRRTVAALEAAGGSVHLTEVESREHDCWSVAFDDYHLLDWLLAQRRGQRTIPPGQVPLVTRLADFARGWQWWQAALQVAIPLALIAAAWRVVRARRRAAEAGAER